MYTLLLSIGIGLGVIALPSFVGLSVTWTALPGTLVGVFAFVWINRRVSKRFEAVIGAADAEMADLQKIAQRPGPGAQAAMLKRFDRAIELLHRGFLFQKWQIGINTMLNARIGILMFTRWMTLQKDGLNESIPYLERARIKGYKAKLLTSLWPAWVMLAVAYYKGKKDLSRCLGVLEDSVKIAPKESLLWAVYAWILWKEKRLDEGIDVLARAAAALPDDPRIQENLTSMQNKKGMKMRGYGEQWYQFGLERPKVGAMQPQMGHPRMRAKGRRR
ncbi:hypothetical protein KKF91_14275 [Myxococcota bacterium]|nr:hypothetical protein [Myxococcota bacterium]MBU1431707.1 hypothetical protein [Myxococcota bacterium]MBU1897090.1 hypothetical protein [Myxococcota bacterium]